MISPQLARALRVAGLRWHPISGDMFLIDRPGFEGDVFALSNMTIEAHEFATGTVLGFNGTTEWALDSVALDDALWLPAEHQLRALLAATFVALRRDEDGYEVETVLAGQSQVFAATDPADAYAGALLVLISASSDEFSAGLGDVASGDAGLGDAGLGDAGMGDAGMGDAGMGDAGPVR
ncbi:pilus assembly protein CpaE [Subtercola lobariae]|uniref:Pilus assembly protein CpaE n=1 Tax=Subtercola lobariae TaxID=1588641 RepID=A0A917EZ45_9MICO|nr:pilus assembly protein CpaE [Subtercola lobariae]GGF27447.1 hypothetical protein GCM10011399_20920 [Subtercola lobariae]